VFSGRKGGSVSVGGGAETRGQEEVKHHVLERSGGNRRSFQEGSKWNIFAGGRPRQLDARAEVRGSENSRKSGKDTQQRGGER